MRPPGALAGFESHGGALSNVLSTLAGDAEVVRAVFARVGVDGAPRDWYPLAKVLAVLGALGEELGADALFRVGRTVPEHAVFPPHIDSAHSALGSVDAAYSMNHRENGQPAADGIGHYRYEHGGGTVAVCTVTSVYPCPFDRGLLTGLAARFVLRPVVVHLEGCRDRGGDRCVYGVTW